MSLKSAYLKMPPGKMKPQWLHRLTAPSSQSHHLNERLDLIFLRAGASCFLPDSDRGITVEGAGILFVAGTGFQAHL